MKKLFTFLAMFLTMNASGQWVWQNPYPQGNDLNHTQYISNNKVLMFGNNGTILTTTNGGDNWIIKHNVCGLLGNLNKSQFIGNTGWAVGDSGCVLKTSDEGNSWTRTQVNLNVSLTDISFINLNTGFVMSGDYIFKTTNGGNSWTTQFNFNPPNVYYGSLYFINENTGWLSHNSSSGYPYCGGGIQKTTNGGINWTSQYGIDGYVSTIKFFDNNTGYVIGGKGVPSVYTRAVLLKTTNAGTNWELNYVNYNDSATGLHSMYFSDLNTGWTANYGKLYKTTNAGINWSTYNLPKSMWYITYSNENYFWGLYYYRIYKSTNSGANWTTVSKSIDSLTTGFNKIEFCDANNGWAQGWSEGNNYFCVTSNGGNNWQRITNMNLNIVDDYHFLNPTTGWILDETTTQYRIGKTTDGGFSVMSTSTFDKSIYLYRIGYSNFNTIKLIGRRSNNPVYVNLILTTTNAGVTWSRDSVINSWDLKYISESSAWSYNVDTIRRTTNNGVNWIKINTPVSIASHLSAIFLDENSCLLYRNDTIITNTLYKTTNAGINWLTINVPNINLSNSSGKYFVLNNNSLWVIGTENIFCPILYKSSNGGLNWTTDRPGISPNKYIRSVYFTNQNTGWVVGDWGEILKTTNSGNVFASNISKEIPSSFSLSQNYPNPFNPITNVKFSIIKAEQVKLIVYDIMGREVQTVVNESMKPGTYEARFDGSQLTSGVYFYKLVTGNFTETKKMLLIK
jgi:photosystem II stability/assembly factor-like uncharacterized protein